MARPHVDLVSQWRIHAPVERVWSALSEPDGWPHWWPAVHAVRRLRPGGPGCQGSLYRVIWVVRGPWRFVVELECIEALPNQRLRGRTQAPPGGEGLWLLRSEAGITDVTAVWRVTPRQRWLAPLLAPVWRWVHREVMRSGEAGLRLLLEGRAADRQPGGPG